MSDNLRRSTFRILDASANRAGEGLRTLEEFARFVLNDSELSSQFKSLRHDLAAAMSRFPRESLLSARDTTGDVGTTLRERSEYERPGVSDVLTAAAERVQQSMRVLEEYGKTIDPSVAMEMEQLRYRCYTVNATLQLHVGINERQKRLAQCRLYVLIDCGTDQATFIDYVTRLAAGKVDILQLRDRNASDRTLLERGRLGAEIARDHGKLFIMNDRADLAIAANADGVHVGQTELPAVDARRIVGVERLVGISTHSIDEARTAVADGADYIGCGPVFPGQTKSFEAYVGVEYLRQIADEIQIPAFAIGGIDASNLDQVIGAGCRRVAVTGAVRDADDPIAAAASLHDLLSC